MLFFSTMISAAKMRELEDKSEQKGISKLRLMENAGNGIYAYIKQKFSDLKDKKILIVAYHGNNGGDGFVAARFLCEECETDVLFVGDETKFKPEADANFKKIEFNERIQLLSDPEQVDFDDYDIIIDALFGTGIKANMADPIVYCIIEMNKAHGFTISVDIPSGLDPDTGQSAGMAVDPDVILTFHDIKQGIIALKDKTVIVDIGIPKEMS